MTDQTRQLITFCIMIYYFAQHKTLFLIKTNNQFVFIKHFVIIMILHYNTLAVIVLIKLKARLYEYVKF